MCWNSVLTYLHISSGAYSCSRMLSKQIVLQFSHINALESMGWLICTTYRSPESFQHNGGNLSIFWPPRKSLVWVFTWEKKTTIQKEEKRKRLKKMIIKNISSATEEIWASFDHHGNLWCEFSLAGEKDNNACVHILHFLPNLVNNLSFAINMVKKEIYGSFLKSEW